MASRTRARLNNLNDRAREVGQSAVLTLEDLDALRQFYNHTCLRCGKSPAISPDHVKPLSEGGANTIENLQLLCDNCNKAKGDKEIDYRQGKVLTAELVAELAKSPEQSTKQTYKKHDWDEIEFEYIHADKFISLRELAKRYDVAFSHISSVAAREDWTRKRDNFRDKLGTDALNAAIQEQIDIRLEIDRTTLDFLHLWRRQHNEISNQDLIKILELGARASGLELDKRTLTVKDWRDAASEQADDIQTFATESASTFYNDNDGASTGWTG